MEFVGFSELLILLACSYTSPTHDLVTLITAEDYFRARNIALNADRMRELAVKDPADPKTQLQQLLAIRWLGENPALTRKADGARAALEQVAAGKKAQDKHGFAKLYARQALARLDGKPLPVARTSPPNGLLDAIRWLTSDATLCFGVELTPARATVPATSDPVRELIAKLAPPSAREEFYKVAEKIGNVRVDRATGGMVFDENGRSERIAFRITGAGNREWLAGLLSQTLRGAVVKQDKGPKGEPITLISSQRDPPAFAFIGDNELIVAGNEKNRANHLAVVEQILAVRAGKEKDITTGKLAGLLREVPRTARSMFVAELPEKMRREMVEPGSPFPVAPQRVVAFLLAGDPSDATKAGLNFRVEATMKDADEAKTLAEAMRRLKQKGLDSLKNLPPGVKVPAETVKAMRRALTDLQLGSSGVRVKAELSLPDEKALFEGLKWVFMSSSSQPDPPPPPRK